MYFVDVLFVFYWLESIALEANSFVGCGNGFDLE